MYGAGKVKGKNHDLKYDLTFSAHTINFVCHSIRSMFRVLGMYNFGLGLKLHKKFNFDRDSWWMVASLLLCGKTTKNQLKVLPNAHEA